MDFVYLKIVLLLHGWVFAGGSSVAMLQHATSSQSIVFHNGPPDSSTTGPNSSSGDRYGTRQPKYEYKYEVSDQHTGDRKSHWESREGDRVRGVYSLYEPDGALRTVEYTADAVHGFNAVVKRNEPNKHQFPGHGSAYSRSSTNTGNGYDTSPSKKIDKTIFSIEDHNGESINTGSKNSFNSEVDFSVNHVFKKIRGTDDLY